MMVKYGQTKQAVMIELVLVLILACVLAYSHMINPVPAETHSSVLTLVDVQAPVPSWSFSAIPDARPAQAKAKLLPRVAKSPLVAEPAPAPIVAATIHDVPEPAPVPVSKEAIIRVPESAAAYVSKPDAAPAPEAVTASVPAATLVSKEALVAVPEAAPVQSSKEALDTALDAAPPVLKVIPASALSPAKGSPSSSASHATPLVAGTAAALALAPFVAPVSIIVGIVVAMFTPHAPQTDQTESVLTRKSR
jgi:hypothetical protein